MGKLTEVSEFVEEVFRLDVDTPVKGYDGKENGPANEQAQALANRTRWLKENLNVILEKLTALTDRKYVASVNEETGEVTITYESIGAAAKVHKHTPEDIETTDDAGFVSKTEKEQWTAKQDVLKSGESIKTLHDNTLLGEGNITLTAEDVGADKTGTAEELLVNHVKEADPHTQYLTKDMAKETYVSTDKADKPLGYVTLDKDGKLTADRIEETDTRLFATPDEKKTWSGKQNTLESGKTIKTINNTPLLGEGDIEITLDSLGAAKAEHTHQADDIITNVDLQFVSEEEKELWTNKQDVLVSGKTIKTLNNKEILGEGDISLTAEDVGSAKAEHKHIPADIVTDDEAGFVSKEERDKWNAKQDNLLSGDYIKTIAGKSLIGSGDVTIDAKDIKVDDDHQFASYEQQENWNSKQERLLSGSNIKTLNKISLLGEGDIQLTYTDVKADKSGAATAAVDEHITQDDPHTQYTLKTDAAKTYVPLADANKPLGYLKLDEKGLLPSNIAKLYQARYLIVDNKEARLAVEKSMNISICLQIDEHAIYYINAEADPSVESNWMPGGSAIVDNVISAFGRSGIVIAENGDYNADQITETDSRHFVTPENKTQWDGKQDKLVSGTNIKTLNNESIVGSGDVSITPESIGAAEKKHTHSAEDIEETEAKQFASQEEKSSWGGKQDLLVSGKTLKTVFEQSLLGEGDIGLVNIPDFAKYLTSIMKAEGDVSITLSSDEKTIVISKEKRGMNIKTVKGAEAGTVYSYEGIGDNFDLSAYALKEVLEKGEQNLAIDYSNVINDVKFGEEPVYESNGSIIDESKTLTYETASISDNGEVYYGGNLFNTPANCTGVSITLNDSLESQVPTMYSDKTVDGIKAVGEYYKDNYPPYRAFQYELTQTAANSVSVMWADSFIWSKKPFMPWVGVDFGSKRIIMAYGFQKFKRFQSSVYTPPTAWEFQGTDTVKDDDSWVTLDKQTGRITSDTYGWQNFKLDKPANYRYYRVLVTDVVNPSAYTAIPRIQLYNNVSALIKSEAGNYYTVDQAGKLSPVSSLSSNRFQTYGFSQTVEPIPVSELGYILPIRLCGSRQFQATVKFYGKVGQIAIHNPIRDTSIWDNMKSLLVSSYYNEEDATGIKFAVTVDGKEFFITDSVEWTSIGELTLDSAGANALLSKGLSLSSLGRINKSTWVKLLESSTGDKRLGIAYAGLIGSKTDTITPKTLEVEFNEISTWVRMSQAEVRIRLNGATIEFTPTEAGNYKFCYRFYE